MNGKNYKISYDRESQALSMELGSAKSVDSDINDNVVIDYDKNGGIVRINLYNFKFEDFRKSQKIFKNFSRVSRVPLLVK